MARARVKSPVSVEPVRWWITAVVLAGLCLFVPIPAWAVDQFYSRNFYSTLQTWFTTASNLIPFALLDFFLILAVYLVLRGALHFVGVVRTAGVMDGMWQLFRKVMRSAGFATAVFMVMWGFNYRRTPLDAALTGSHLPPPSVDALRAAIADANVLAARVRGRSGKADLSFENVSKELREPMNDALKQLQRAPLLTPGRPKYSLVMTPLFTWTGMDSMLDPIALESIVHPDLLPFERPFVLAKEWAHLAGHADEAEASAVGWLACMHGPPALAYSASLYLILEARAALPPEARAAATAQLDPGVRSDIGAIEERLLSENPTMQRAADRAYDEYLRVNRMSNGPATYQRALALILASPVHDALGNYRFGARTD